LEIISSCWCSLVLRRVIKHRATSGFGPSRHVALRSLTVAIGAKRTSNAHHEMSSGLFRALRAFHSKESTSLHRSASTQPLADGNKTLVFRLLYTLTTARTFHANIPVHSCLRSQILVTKPSPDCALSMSGEDQKHSPHSPHSPNRNPSEGKMGNEGKGGKDIPVNEVVSSNFKRASPGWSGRL
jgi:hypothetical protein